MKKKNTNAFLSIFTLTSRIPVPWKFEVDYSWIGVMFPLTGVIAALCFWGAWQLGFLIFHNYFMAAVLGLIVQYGLFNLFHFDGLLDSADALLCFASKEKRLEILKDSRIGSFALFAGAVYLILKLYLLYEIPQKVQGDLWFLFLLFPVTGRVSAVLIPCFLKPAKPEGLGAALSPYHPKRILIPILLLAAASTYAAVFHGYLGAVPFFGVLLGFLSVYIFYKKEIHGYTGDALGASVEQGELLYLLTFFGWIINCPK